jgi:hypothetical protein
MEKVAEELYGVWKGNMGRTFPSSKETWRKVAETALEHERALVIAYLRAQSAGIVRGQPETEAMAECLKVVADDIEEGRHLGAEAPACPECEGGDSSGRIWTIDNRGENVGRDDCPTCDGQGVTPGPPDGNWYDCPTCHGKRNE